MTNLDTAENLVSLGEAMRSERRTEEALGLFQKAVSISPDFLKGHHGLVLSLQSLGRTDQALSACKEGLRFHPKDRSLNELMADLLLGSKPAEALEYLCALLTQYPEDNRIWFRFGWALSSVPIRVSPVTRPWLLKALSHPVISAENISLSIWKGLLHENPISELIASSQADEIRDGGRLKEWLSVLGADPLLIGLMETSFVPIPLVEQLFTRLRHALLFEMDVSSGTPPPDITLLLCPRYSSVHF